MSDNNCPFCGTPLEDGQTICPQCSETARQRTSLDLQYEEVDDKSSSIDHIDSDGKEEGIIDEAKNIERAKNTSNKKLLLYFSFATILFIAAGSFVFIQHKKEKEAEHAELKVWFSCIEKNTPGAYSEYLYLYPTGKFHEEAQLKIAELRRIEFESWEKLKNSTDIFEYTSFLNQYPETPFKNDIKHRMDSLSWIIAQKENTADSYLNYVENAKLGNITGYYSAIANEKYDYLKSIRTIEGTELDSIKTFIKEYFEDLSKQNFKKLKNSFTPTLTNFYGETNHSSATIIKTIQNDIKKNRVKSIIYAPELKDIVVIQDSAKLYSTEVKVLKKISFNTKKKKNETNNEVLNLVITPELKVRSMYIKEVK